MSQQTLIAIATMLNAFPQAAGDVDVLVRSFDAATEKMPPRAVCEAAELYMRGDVKGQNLRYAPTDTDLVAYVALDRRVIAYRTSERIAQSTVLRIADYRGQYACKTGAFVEDFPLERALQEMGL
jgi:hypothetical protein